jgi:hypothetical protein
VEKETQHRYRISICKANGSVWMEECEDISVMIEQIERLLNKHPHLLVSRQKVVEKNE